MRTGSLSPTSVRTSSRTSASRHRRRHAVLHTRWAWWNLRHPARSGRGSIPTCRFSTLRPNRCAREQAAGQHEHGRECAHQRHSPAHECRFGGAERNVLDDADQHENGERRRRNRQHQPEHVRDGPYPPGPGSAVLGSQRGPCAERPDEGPPCHGHIRAHDQTRECGHTSPDRHGQARCATGGHAHPHQNQRPAREEDREQTRDRPAPAGIGTRQQFQGLSSGPAQRPRVRPPRAVGRGIHEPLGVSVQ